MNIFNHFCEENKTLLNLIKKELLQYNDINQNQLFNGVDTIIHKHTKNIEKNEALYKMQQSLAVLNHEIKIGEFNTKNNYVALTLDIDEVYYNFLYEKKTEEKNDEYGHYNKKDIDLLQIAINNFLVIKNELEDEDKAISTQLKLRKNESIVNLKNHSNSKSSSFIFSFSNDQQSQYENYEILKNAYDLNDSFECLLKNYPQHAMDFIFYINQQTN